MVAECHGILNINKPAGWTSHDVVARIRRLLGVHRVGHAGTLDPMATGVLLVCVGQATRVAEYLMLGQKTYRAMARLGVITDTYDLAGEVIAVAPVPDLAWQDLAQALSSFVGDIEQTPPPYSAIKEGGVPAYRKARKGQAVRLSPRRVRIQRIELLDWHSPQLTFEVVCAPGTYIRSLAHELGRLLGCGAALAELSRLRSGSFALDAATSLEELAEAANTGQIARYMYPVEAALGDLTPVAIDLQARNRLLNGQPIPCPVTPTLEAGYAVEQDGTVRAILAYDAPHQLWRPRKVFPLSP